MTQGDTQRSEEQIMHTEEDAEEEIDWIALLRYV